MKVFCHFLNKNYVSSLQIQLRKAQLFCEVVNKVLIDAHFTCPSPLEEILFLSIVYFNFLVQSTGNSISRKMIFLLLIDVQGNDTNRDGCDVSSWIRSCLLYYYISTFPVQGSNREKIHRTLGADENHYRRIVATIPCRSGTRSKDNSWKSASRKWW